MDARTQRTLIRLLALFLAVGGGDCIVQFVVSDSYDWRHLAGALVAAAVLAVEKYLSESNDALAAPTVDAVNVALEHQRILGPIAAASVPPPSMPIEPPPA
jgi:hypothetical protein